MKKFTPAFWLQICIVLSMLCVGWFLYDRLPEQIPVHWNVEGEVDNYTSKLKGVLLLPLINLLMVILFPIFKKIDPKREKYATFQRPWLIIQTVLVLFFAYIYFVSLYLALNPYMSVEPFIFGGLGVLFIVIGNYLGKIRQNYFMGIRTPWTLNNEEVWNKTHRVAGWSFVIGGLLVFAEAFLQWKVVYVMIFAISFAILVPVVYSYLEYRKTTSSKK